MEEIKSSLILKDDLVKAIDEKKLIVRPLLESSQIGEISIDLRIGTDFLSSQQGREPFIDATLNVMEERPIQSFFNPTRRKVGETFLFNPGQTIIFSTLEYLKIPNNMMAVLSARSSYSRLGLSVSTIVQPGYCGCISIEVIYTGNIPIRVLSGARFLQARFYKIGAESSYFSSSRKYICQVRPIPSKANEDKDLGRLRALV